MNVLTFDDRFDGTDMSINEIQRKAREKGWPGIHIDADDFTKTGKLIIKRLTRKAALGEG